MKEKLSIRVNIADRFYPLRIDLDEEEKIRRAARQINEKILQYKQRYSDKDTQDFLAMAALQFVTKNIEIEENKNSSEIEDSLKEINDELDRFLKNENIRSFA